MSPDKQPFAAFTITRNEPLFLRAWCNYYCNEFGPSNVHVIDNSSTDGSVEEVKGLWPDITVVSQPSALAHNSLWLKNVVERYQRFLLETHDVVVFAETDEFLIPSVQYAGLLDYCEQFRASDKEHARAVGWNVVHQVDNEPDLERSPGERMLEHRDSMWRIGLYDKTLITRVPLAYQKGFHNIFRDEKRWLDAPRDEELSLFHAWCVDVNEFHRRHGARLNVDLEGARQLFRNMAIQTNGFGDQWIEGERHDVPSHWVSLIHF